MDNLPTPISKESYSLWDALKAGNPGLEAAPIKDMTPAPKFDNFPGLKDWLVSEYALDWPTKRIGEHLKEIRDQQREENLQTWPELNKREIDRYRSEWRADWLPIRSRLSQNIENTGVLAKNNRLLALMRTASELEERMWEERNSRTGQLYLIGEFRQIMRQIAEEKGELGEEGRIVDNTLFVLANALSEAVKVQGAGIQKRDAVIDAEFTYYPENDTE